MMAWLRALLLRWLDLPTAAEVRTLREKLQGARNVLHCWAIARRAELEMEEQPSGEAFVARGQARRDLDDALLEVLGTEHERRGQA